MKKLLALMILSHICYTGLCYTQDILDDLEFSENRIYTNFIMNYIHSPSPYPSPYPLSSPSSSPSPSPSPPFKISNLVDILLIEQNQ